MSQRSRVPGMRASGVTRIPLCTLHLADCIKLDGRFVCPVCMQENEPALTLLMPNRRARRALLR